MMTITRTLRRLIILFLLYFITTDVFSRPYLKIQEISVKDYPEIRAEVSVSDITPIGDLSESNFDLYEGGWKVNYFQVKKTEPEVEPKNLVLLIDASRSLDEQSFQLQIEAVMDFIEGLNPHDKVAVISFEDKVTIRCAFTDARDQIKSCVENVKRGGTKTVLLDAIEEAWSLIEKNAEERNSVILFSDGKEEGSDTILQELMADAHKTRIPTFIVGTGKKAELQNLAKISHATGGEIYHTAQKENIGKIYRLLSRLLDNTYIIRYQSDAQKLGGGMTKLEIRFHAKELKDQDVAEYYAPAGIFRKAVYLTGMEERDILVLLGLVFILMLMMWIAITLKKVRPAVKKEAVKSSPVSAPVYTTDELILEEPMEPKKAVDVQPPLPIDYRHAYILEKEGPNTGRKYPVRWHSVTIGHGDENSIVLDDSTVSYSHAKIELRSGDFYLYDLMSERGVFLNGKKLLRPRVLRDFDQIELGRTVLMFRKAAG